MTADVPTLVAGAVGVAVILVLGRVALIPSNRLGVSVFHPYRDDPWPAGVQEDDDARFRWTRRPEATREAEPEDALEHVAFRPPRAAPRDPETPPVRGDRRTRRGRPAPGTRRRPPCASLIAARRAAERPRCRSTRPRWVRDAVFYQIFPDRFARSERVAKPGTARAVGRAADERSGFKGGDLRGVGEHLDYLEDLGRQRDLPDPDLRVGLEPPLPHVRLLPVDPLLGGDAALRELLDAAHARGMRVVLDGVFNHAGRGFWPFHHVLETGAASPYRDWFHLDPAGLDAGPAAPRLSRRREPVLGRRAVDRGPRRDGVLRAPRLPGLVGPAGAAQAQHRRTRRSASTCSSVAEHWLRFGVDGWRLDVAEEIDDGPSGRSSGARCRAVDPDAYIVGEIWHVAPEWLRGRPVRRADELPARRGDPRLRRRRAPRPSVVRRPARVPATGPAARRAGVRGPARAR